MAVTIFASDEAAETAIRQLAAKVAHDCPPIVVMDLPGLLTHPVDRIAPKAVKTLRLLRWARRLRACDALLCAERTSTVLTRLPGRMPLFLHIPHGAGDRAVGFEPRLSRFDHVIVSGAKDRDRMVSEGIVQPHACHIGGAVKLAAMMRGERSPIPLSGQRPVVLYNPHFSETLGSFAAVADRLIDAVAADGRYDLVVAPHIRLAELWSPEKRANWEARSIPGRILVDMGSDRSIDMTYTLSADVYLGDVSSQIYEFAYQPRPCLFINAHGVAWQGDPSYEMWKMGPVSGRDDDLVAAIDHAVASHAQYVAVQTERAGLALGDAGRDAIEVTADLITRLCRPIS